VSAIAALIVAAAVGVGWKWLAPDATPASLAVCRNITPLTVTADPSVVPIVRQVAKSYDAVDVHCSKITVTAQDSADTASVLAAGNGERIAVWIPDSLVWVSRMQSIAASLDRTAPAMTAQDPVASSPVVFALPAAKAGRIGDTPLSWARVLDGSVDAVIPNPEASGPSLAGLLALSAHAGGNTQRLNASLIALGKTIPASADAAFATSASAASLTVAIVSEQQVAAYNAAEANSAHELTAVYPSDGTLSVAYPYVVAGGASDSVKTLAGGFQRALLKQSALFTAAGFRDGAGHGTVDRPGIVPTANPVQAATDGKTELALYKTWGVLTLRGRMLGIVDVSGSMAEPAGNGLNRIDVFQQSAMGAISRFSGQAELGLWVFSTNQNGTVPYRQVSPIAPLGDAAHSADLARQIAALPGELKGDTGLYDTTLAAVRNVRATYDPTRVNSVIVITDGVNDDKSSTTTLQQLVTTLKKEADPSKRVPVIMIGFGPDTDLAAMTQIAKATGGAAYSAQKPQDLSNVLTTALTERSCRPNCTAG
jgi:hypothetical protein